MGAAMENPDVRLALYGQPAFEAIVRLKDPDVAMLYALACTQKGQCTAKEAAETLGWPAARAEAAASLLKICGLSEGGPPPQREPDGQDIADIAQAREGDTMFSSLCSYTEAALGRILRKAELETLHWIYGNLGLPADVLVLLINLCRENGRLSARELQRQACRWHDEGIDTYDRAEAYLAEQKRLKSRGWAIRRMMGIQDRRPSDSEDKYIEDWVQKGLADELVRLAYDRTVTRTGKLSWGYMNKILQSWHSQGLKTVAAVEAHDKAPAKAAPGTPPMREETVEAAVLRDYGQKRKTREEELKRRLDGLVAKSPAFADIESRRRLCASRLARALPGQKPPLEEELASVGRQRAEILKGLGHDARWLDDIPDCPLCGDRGYIGTTMCSCFKQACQKEEERRKNL